MLRILFCSAAYQAAPTYGGPVQLMTTLASGLRHRGHDVTVWAADYGDPPQSGDQERYFRRMVSYRWSPLAAGVLYAALREPNVDVVHCFGYREGVTTFAAAGFRLRRVPYVVEPMGMVVPRVRNLPAKRAFDTTIGHRYLRGSARVMVTSQLELDDVAAATPEARTELRRVPLQLPAHAPERTDLRRQLDIPPEATTALFLGRVSTKKGLDLLVPAVAGIESVHLVVAGPDAHDGGERQLNDAVRAAGIGDRVHRLPPVWSAERDALLAAADMFVLPSRTENFGIAAAEAAALGTPVIVSDQCGVAELVTKLDAGRVCSTDVASIAAALRTMRDDPALRRRVGGNGRRIRDELDADRIVDQQVAIYEEVVG